MDPIVEMKWSKQVEPHLYSPTSYLIKEKRMKEGSQAPNKTRVFIGARSPPNPEVGLPSIRLI